MIRVVRCSASCCASAAPRSLSRVPHPRGDPVNRYDERVAQTLIGLARKSTTTEERVRYYSAAASALWTGWDEDIWRQPGETTTPLTSAM